jgi:hypothetical protein
MAEARSLRKFPPLEAELATVAGLLAITAG